MKIIAVIPARYQSSRLPGKPLALICGIPMIQRVYEQAQKVERLDEVIVATDDQRIFDLVESFGGKVQMTDPNHQNGTERCAEIAAAKPEVDLVINIQGDEPFIAAAQIDLLIDQLISQKKGIASLAKRIRNLEDWLNPNIVKVLFDKYGKVLYFSRAPLPYHRKSSNSEWDNQQKHFKHIGLYGYYRNTLLEITKLSPAPLEIAESLEQLRWLENGHTIGIAITNTESISVDTESDIKKAEEWFRKQIN